MVSPALYQLRWSVLALLCSVVLLLYAWLSVPTDPLAGQRSREDLARTITVQTRILSQSKDWKRLESYFQGLMEAEPRLRSIGYRNTEGKLLAATRGHRAAWETRDTPQFSLPVGDNELTGTLECTYSNATDPISQGSNGWAWFLAAVSGIGFTTAGLLAKNPRTIDNAVVPDRVRQALDTLAEGLLVLDEQEKIVLANRAFAETAGLSPAELVGRTASSLAWISDDATARGGFPWIRSLLDNRPQIDQTLQYELEDGGRRVFSVNSSPIINAAGKRHGALATFRDITEMEEHRAQLENMLVMLRSSRDEISRKNRELEVLATQDALTGCLNRRAFFDRFSKAWEQATSMNMPLSVVMVDNDHFKSVNDTYGHHTGDEVLRAVAAALRKLHSPPNMVCRYGGEEFCVLLPGKDYQQALAMAEEIRIVIESIRLRDPEELRLTASLGVSEIGYGAKDPQDLINQADKCLYFAKRAGRNRVVGYVPEMAEMEIDESKVSRTKKEQPAGDAIPYPAVSALLGALGYRDAETAEHSRRVADLVVSAADGLLSQSDTYVLEIAALLHDVGKVGVPDHILLKDGPLTDDEWEIMRRHQRIGVELVATTFNNPQLETILRSFRMPYHGDPKNPNSLRGEQIDICARLLAVADSYDSMVTEHAYRRAFTPQQAFRELRRCANRQFDAQLVERFINIIEQKLEAEPGREGEGISPQMAIQLGSQLERLADALDQRDLPGLAALAARLRDTAQQANLQEIVRVATRLEMSAKQDEPLIKMVGLTTELLQLCRTSQAPNPPKSQNKPHF